MEHNIQDQKIIGQPKKIYTYVTSFVCLGRAPQLDSSGSPRHSTYLRYALNFLMRKADELFRNITSVFVRNINGF